MDRPAAPDRRPAGAAAAPSDAEALRAEVRRLRAENRTLVRLNRLQGRFVAMASHEFKTPLTSITAYTDALLAHAGEADFVRGPEFLGIIRDESARLLRMVNRILDFSRMEYGSKLLDRRPVDLAELAGRTLRTLEASAAARRQRLALAADADLPRAEVDADLVRQVLVNLVGNAVKYTPPGSRIEVGVAEGAATVDVAVADDGPGIPPDELRRIFREFYRAEGAAAGENGTGLGLSIVRHIVSLHGGQVAVGPRPGGGTVFTVGLPKEVRTAEAAAGAPAAHPGVLRALLRMLLEHAGCRAALVALPAPAGLAAAAWAGLPAGTDPATAAAVPPAAADTGGAALAAGFGLAGTAGDWLAAPLREGAGGWLLLGRRAGAEAWTGADRAQVRVLARIAAQALRAGADEPGRTVEALRVLLQMRRGGVPTATPAALDLTTALAARLGLDAEATLRLQDAAALHDAGMARVDDEILHGEGDLDWDARDEVDRHVELGLDLLAPLLTDGRTAAVIRHHHERFDGAGHPDGLAGEAIPLGSRALAVIDAWHSLTRERPYRAGLAPAAALAEIGRCAGTQFDPAVVAALAAELAARGGDRPEPGAAAGAPEEAWPCPPAS